MLRTTVDKQEDAQHDVERIYSLTLADVHLDDAESTGQGDWRSMSATTTGHKTTLQNRCSPWGYLRNAETRYKNDIRPIMLYTVYFPVINFILHPRWAHSNTVCAAFHPQTIS